MHPLGSPLRPKGIAAAGGPLQQNSGFFKAASLWEEWAIGSRGRIAFTADIKKSGPISAADRSLFSPTMGIDIWRWL